MKTVTSVLFIGMLVALFPAAVFSQETEADRAAIQQAALDYIEGWFEGNAERMDRALHPQLAKRLVTASPQTGEEVFRNLTKDDMVNYTKQGGGKSVPADKREIKVTILDMARTMASVRVDSSQFVDFLHLANTGGQWKIVNVLWENVIKQRKEAKVDPNLYEAYAGEYELAPNFVVAITTEGGRIFAQATGQSQVEIFPESETKFFLKVVEAQITFVRDEAGKVVQLILHQGGQDIPGKKIK